LRITIPSGGTLKVMSGQKAVPSAGTLVWTQLNIDAIIRGEYRIERTIRRNIKSL
jgi:hypothetical protein